MFHHDEQQQSQHNQHLHTNLAEEFVGGLESRLAGEGGLLDS
jgi:hypothetical protein